MRARIKIATIPPVPKIVKASMAVSLSQIAVQFGSSKVGGDVYRLGSDR
jgi:hypothetical protein